ncbi:MAG: glutamate 5-kinase [Lachnospiraceae bacterium]|uniref:Glutamate 5-kinase n=1 Tax=Candidatus Weimeria bifida TaxID=2599074 RepID=A0A6N7J201_9FIRM|nr:glutamate 5-kinase [Candidatus Weimeria bifida]RRF97022.1 MAG: glutamate 5-kinase [Lachnospiraceae bacterium]
MVDKKRIVVKVGTSTLTNELGNPNLREFDKLSLVLSDVHNMGYDIILVSSGAIAVGASDLHLKEKPTELRYKQACAAVGQCSNMFYYDKFFGEYGQQVAQILFNSEDVENELKKENLTNTINTLLEMGIIPIVNENDSVSYTEIDSEDHLFSDNDKLSAVIAILCNAGKLVIFSDIDGFFDKDPRLYADAKLIDRIDDITEDTFNLAGGAGSRRGTGGMQTKLEAAQLATAQGISVIVTNGAHPDTLYKIVEGRKAGTLFKGKKVF